MTAAQRRSEAKAFRLWRAAEALAWDCTLAEAARQAGIGIGAAKHIAAKKGWRDRFSGTRTRCARPRGGPDPWAPETFAEIMGA